MTFEKAFEAALAEIDRRYEDLRVIIADPNFNNRLNREWTNASDKYLAAIDAIFRLKTAWLESRALLEPREGRE